MRFFRVTASCTACICIVLTGCIAPATEPDDTVVFESETVDVGDIAPGQFVHAKFKLENMSDSALVVKSIYTSCGCISKPDDGFRIAGKSHGSLDFVLTAPKRPDQLLKKVLVTFDRSPEVQKVLAIKANVIPLFSILPSKLDLSSDPSSCATVKVTRSLASPSELETVDVVSESDCIVIKRLSCDQDAAVFTVAISGDCSANQLPDLTVRYLSSATGTMHVLKRLECIRESESLFPRAFLAAQVQRGSDRGDRGIEQVQVFSFVDADKRDFRVKSVVCDPRFGCALVPGWKCGEGSGLFHLWVEKIAEPGHHIGDFIIHYETTSGDVQGRLRLPYVVSVTDGDGKSHMTTGE